MKVRSLASAALAAGMVFASPALARSKVEVSPSGQAIPAGMPRTASGPGLARRTVLTRIAVGSCNRQDAPQSFWQVIAARDPQLFLMIGDNVYGDPGWDGGADLGTFRAAYARLAGSAEFTAFRKAVPMLETWDDHDFGNNDAGGSFAYKQASEALFEHFWNAPREVRARPGVQRSAIYGPAGRRVQVILLDTRFFRTDLVRLPREQQRGLGAYASPADPAADMLGADQWRWLERELARPADLRIVVSSVQLISEAHDFEAWARMPLQRQKLMSVLAGRRTSGLVVLSGDRHGGALYTAALPGGETLRELTASSLNAPMSAPDPSAREPDADRRGPLFGQTNFGEIEIDWRARRLALVLRGMDGGELLREGMAF